MTFEAKTLVPLPCDPEAAHATFEAAASGSITLFEAPAGFALPGLAGAGPCVLVSHPGPQAADLGQCQRRSACELRLSASAVSGTLEKWAPDLTARARNRAMWLVGGRAGLLAGLRELASTTDL